MAAYYQPSLTEEYDEDSPGGDFDFFSNLVTKWEAAAKLPGESTRQVVVRSGEDRGPGNQAKWKICGPGRAELTVRGHVTLANLERERPRKVHNPQLSPLQIDTGRKRGREERNQSSADCQG